MSYGYRILFVLLVVGIGAFFVVQEVKNQQYLPAVSDTTNGIVSAGVSKDSIPAIDRPTFESVAMADTHLSDEGEGIALTLNGSDRFYPYQILAWHFIVNDDVRGRLVVVTYDPLCGSSLVYDRVLNDTTYEFSVSGSVKNNNFLMQDRQTTSLWEQVTGQSVDGLALLQLIPSTVMTWKEWKAAHSDGSVLSRNTGFERDYTTNPYLDYATSEDIYFPLDLLDGNKLSKERVTGPEGRIMYAFCRAAFYPSSEPLSPQSQN